MDFPVDVEEPQSPVRKPQNWEVFKALESVSPPSPSPSFRSDFLAYCMFAFSCFRVPEGMSGTLHIMR